MWQDYAITGILEMCYRSMTLQDLLPLNFSEKDGSGESPAPLQRNSAMLTFACPKVKVVPEFCKR